MGGRKAWSRRCALQHTLHEKNKTLPDDKKTKNLWVIQLLLGHKNLESTVRYLGIEVDDALEISESIEV